MPEARTPKRRLGRKLLLSLTVLLCTVLGLEIAARVWLGDEFRAGEIEGASWSVLARREPNLGWANRPAAQGSVVTPDFRYRARINSLGLRDPELELRKRGGTQRVLFLGDSMTWGWGVNDGQRFSDLIAADLAPKVQVVNLAVPGYGTDQELWSLEERGESLDPDAVVLVFVLNDVLECDLEVGYGMTKPRFVLERGTWNIVGRPAPNPQGALRRWMGQPLADLGAHSALVSGLRRSREQPTFAEEKEERRRPFRPDVQAHVRAVAERLLDQRTPCRHALGLVHAWCESRSIPFLVLGLPHKHDQYLYEPSAARPEFEGATDVSKVLARVGAELGFPVVDVDRAMWEATGRGVRLHCGDGHLNEAGNQLVAREFGPRLAELLAP